jgi:protein SCO1/2
MINLKTSGELAVPTVERIDALRQVATPELGREYWAVFAMPGRLVKPRPKVDVAVGTARPSGAIVDQLFKGALVVSKRLLACGLLLGVAVSGYAATPTAAIGAAAGATALALAAAPGQSAPSTQAATAASRAASPSIETTAARASRSIAAYSVPQVELVRDDGRVVRLADELADSRPVVLNFIYTTCNGICPMLSETFSFLQSKLGAQRDSVRLVSISIDPEQDTPQRLAAYAKRFHAGPEWHHYTGTLAASVLVQRSFGVYRGDKMSHTPVTLLRPAPGMPWVRFDGYATADELIQELGDRIANP